MTRRNRRPRRALSLLLVVELVLGSVSSAAVSAAEGPGCSTESDLSRLPAVLAEVQGAGTSASGCSNSGAGAPGARSARLSCPHRILDRLSKDQKKGWMKESPSESCLIAGAATKASPAEIESRLARHPSTSLGGRVDGLEQSCGSSLSGVSSEDRKLLAAEFHLDMNRLKQAEVSSHESIAAIDSVLGTGEPRHCRGVGETRDGTGIATGPAGIGRKTQRDRFPESSDPAEESLVDQAS